MNENAITVNFAGAVRPLSSLSPRTNPWYSPNLYQWMKKNFNRVHFYVDEGEEWLLRIYVGVAYNDGWFIGSDLRSVFTDGARAPVFALMPRHTKRFRADPLAEGRYLSMGRCGLFPDHPIHFEGMWRYPDEHTRICNWCGYTETRVKTGERVVEEFGWVHSLEGSNESTS